MLPIHFHEYRVESNMTIIYGGIIPDVKYGTPASHATHTHTRARVHAHTPCSKHCEAASYL